MHADIGYETGRKIRHGPFLYSPDLTNLRGALSSGSFSERWIPVSIFLGFWFIPPLSTFITPTSKSFHRLLLDIFLFWYRQIGWKLYLTTQKVNWRCLNDGTKSLDSTDGVYSISREDQSDILLAHPLFRITCLNLRVLSH